MTTGISIKRVVYSIQTSSNINHPLLSPESIFGPHKCHNRPCLSGAFLESTPTLQVQQAMAALNEKLREVQRCSAVGGDSGRRSKT